MSSIIFTNATDIAYKSCLWYALTAGGKIALQKLKVINLDGVDNRPSPEFIKEYTFYKTAIEAPVIEEFFFRDLSASVTILLDSKLSNAKEISNLATSILFGMLHLKNYKAISTGSILDATYAFITSYFLLSQIYNDYGLLGSIFSHALLNFITIIL